MKFYELSTNLRTRYDNIVEKKNGKKLAEQKL